MSPCNRIFIVGHPGAGKAFLAKNLAEQLGWTFIDADLGLEARIGRTIHEIVGQGEHDFYQCQHNILEALCHKENVVITTDASAVCCETIRDLLSLEFTIYLSVSVPIQIERTTHQAEFLLSTSDRKRFFEQLHHERDALYQEISKMHVDSDNSALDDHVSMIMKYLAKEPAAMRLNAQDLIVFHKTTHTPTQLSMQQALSLNYLAQGLSAKEIAREMNLSYRTVEGTLAKTMELLGCTSSKELIALYHAKH